MTMHQEKYNLTWHSHSDHLKSMMKDLMMNEEFSDVTLVTEDKKQIMAHINILSACSPVFKDILKKDKNSNPILYLRGIQYSELKLSCWKNKLLFLITFKPHKRDKELVSESMRNMSVIRISVTRYILIEEA